MHEPPVLCKVTSWCPGAMGLTSAEPELLGCPELAPLMTAVMDSFVPYSSLCGSLSEPLTSVCVWPLPDTGPVLCPQLSQGCSGGALGYICRSTVGAYKLCQVPA